LPSLRTPFRSRGSPELGAPFLLRRREIVARHLGCATRCIRTVIPPLPKSRPEDTAPLRPAKRLDSTLLGRLAEVPGRPGESTGRKRGQNMPRTFTHGLKFIAVSALKIAVVFARADMEFAYSRHVDARYAANDGGIDKGKADKGNK